MFSLSGTTTISQMVESGEVHAVHAPVKVRWLARWRWSGAALAVTWHSARRIYVHVHGRKTNKSDYPDSGKSENSRTGVL